MELIAYAERAVALVNTADPCAGRDLLDRPAEAREVLGAGRLSRMDVGALKIGRSRLSEVFQACQAGRAEVAVRRLNALLAAHPVNASISGHDGEDWHLHLSDDATAPGERYMAGAAFGLAVAVTTLGPDQLGTCTSGRCRAVFLDTSTNRSRRYCSDRCATRANVAAYRARRKAAARGG